MARQGWFQTNISHSRLSKCRFNFVHQTLFLSFQSKIGMKIAKSPAIISNHPVLRNQFEINDVLVATSLSTANSRSAPKTQILYQTSHMAATTPHPPLVHLFPPQSCQNQSHKQARHITFNPWNHQSTRIKTVSRKQISHSTKIRKHWKSTRDMCITMSRIPSKTQLNLWRTRIILHTRY